VAAGALFFALGVLVVAWNLPLPLIAYSPGPVMDVVDAVSVEGAPLYETDGELLQLTVAGQDINAFEALVAATDPTVDVLARDVVRRPDESDEDYRRRNLQLMDQSTATAISVALEHVEVEEQPRVFITGYAADTPAGEVLEIGDRIVTIEEETVESTEDLAEVIDNHSPGDAVRVEVERGGEVHSYEVELVAHEEFPDRPIIGIFVRDLPFWIEIDSGIVGGPSAGMMYSLGIIDVLTPGSLTNGAVVAGTGTVDVDGNVGNIGGVRQKVVASEAAGAEYMLLPEGNYEAASSAPSRDIELVPVATVDEALDFLSGLSE
jgi:PDZ domain-containing protein